MVVKIKLWHGFEIQFLCTEVSPYIRPQTGSMFPTADTGASKDSTVDTYQDLFRNRHSDCHLFVVMGIRWEMSVKAWNIIFYNSRMSVFLAARGCDVPSRHG